MSDVVDVEILDDGTFKISTDKISMANHGGAETLIKMLVAGAGGESKRVRKGTHTVHEHDGHFHSHEE